MGIALWYALYPITMRVTIGCSYGSSGGNGTNEPHSCIKKMAIRIKTLVSIELTAYRRQVRGINQR
jgi:hypothetical protein